MATATLDREQTYGRKQPTTPSRILVFLLHAHISFSRRFWSYISPELQSRGGMVGIWPTLNSISDHSPIFIKIKPRGPTLHRPPHFDKSQLRTDQGRAKLTLAWKTAIQNNQDKNWTCKTVAALTAVQKSNAQEAAKQREAWREMYQQQTAEILAAELHLQNNWNDSSAREALNATQSKLQTIRHSRLSNQVAARHSSRANTLLSTESSRLFKRW